MATPAYTRVLAMQSEIKALVTEDGGGRYIEGMASTSGIDDTREIVMPSAFDAGLEKFMQHPVISWNHDWSQPIGKVEKAEVRSNGLWIRARMIDAGDPLGDMVWSRIEQGIVGALSIGFDGRGDTPGHYEEEKGIWFWDSIQLREIAVTPLPANYECTMQAAKSLGISLALPDRMPKTKSHSLLPGAPDDYEWDPVAALKRVCEWAGDDAEKHAKAFAHFDGENAKVLIADVIDGELKAVWPAVAAATASAFGLRGGPGIPDDAIPDLRKSLAEYYEVFEKQAPVQIDETVEFAEHEKELFEEENFSRTTTRLRGDAISATNAIRHWQKEGRVLSAANRGKVEAARDALDGVLQADATSRESRALPTLALPEKPKIALAL